MPGWMRDVVSLKRRRGVAPEFQHERHVPLRLCLQTRKEALFLIAEQQDY